MYEWTQNNLYEELLTMPLWVSAAFGTLNKGDILTPDDTRYILITYLVNNHIQKCPINDNDHRHNWKTSQYCDVVFAAVKRCRWIINDSLYVLHE